MRELGTEHVFTRLEFRRDELLLGLDAEEVVNVVEPLVLEEERMAAKTRAVREDDAGCLCVRELDIRDDLVRTTANVDGDALGHRSSVRVIDVLRAFRFCRRTFGREQLGRVAIVEWQDKILVRLLEPGLDQRLE